MANTQLYNYKSFLTEVDWKQLKCPKIKGPLEITMQPHNGELHSNKRTEEEVGNEKRKVHNSIYSKKTNMNFYLKKKCGVGNNNTHIFPSICIKKH